MVRRWVKKSITIWLEQWGFLNRKLQNYYNCMHENEVLCSHNFKLLSYKFISLRTRTLKSFQHFKPRKKNLADFSKNYFIRYHIFDYSFTFTLSPKKYLRFSRKQSKEKFLALLIIFLILYSRSHLMWSLILLSFG